MPKIETSTAVGPITPTNPQRYFKFNGLEYEIGTWTLKYFNDDTVGIYYKNDPFVAFQNPIHYSSYTNTYNAPYGSLDSLLTDLGSLLNLGK